MKLQPMDKAPKDKVILIDVGYSFLTPAMWNHLNQTWVYCMLQCDDDGQDTWFNNEHEAEPSGWVTMPDISKD